MRPRFHPVRLKPAPGLTGRKPIVVAPAAHPVAVTGPSAQAPAAHPVAATAPFGQALVAHPVAATAPSVQALVAHPVAATGPSAQALAAHPVTATGPLAQASVAPHEMKLVAIGHATLVPTVLHAGHQASGHSARDPISRRTRVLSEARQGPLARRARR